MNPNNYLYLSALLFTVGAAGVLLRRNAIVMFMCVELMLNAANIAFVTFARMLNDIGGQALVFFVLVVAAAEAHCATSSASSAGSAAVARTGSSSGTGALGRRASTTAPTTAITSRAAVASKGNR